MLPVVRSLGPSYDLDKVFETGIYESLSPSNGPDSGDWIVFHILAPRTSVGDIEAVQFAISKTDGAFWSRACDGSVWADWAQGAGGGGGGGGSSYDPTAVEALVGTFPIPFGVPDFATFIAALGLSGTPEDTQGAISIALAIGLILNSQLTTTNKKATVIKANRAPTNADGSTVDFTNATDFDQPNTYAMNFGSIWVDVGSARNDAYMIVTTPQSGTGNVWKKLTP